jgi:hypothetical protein
MSHLSRCNGEHLDCRLQPNRVTSRSQHPCRVLGWHRPEYHIGLEVPQREESVARPIRLQGNQLSGVERICVTHRTKSRLRSVKTANGYKLVSLGQVHRSARCHVLTHVQPGRAIERSPWGQDTGILSCGMGPASGFTPAAAQTDIC